MVRKSELPFKQKTRASVHSKVWLVYPRGCSEQERQYNCSAMSLGQIFLKLSHFILASSFVG